MAPASPFGSCTVTCSRTLAAIVPNAAHRSDMPPVPTSLAGIAGEASQLFCDNLLQNLPVQCQVRHQTLQTAVLIAKLTQFVKFLYAQPRKLLLPHVERRLADSQLA